MDTKKENCHLKYRVVTKTLDRARNTFVYEIESIDGSMRFIRTSDAPFKDVDLLNKLSLEDDMI